jgi:hypothetical protein
MQNKMGISDDKVIFDHTQSIVTRWSLPYTNDEVLSTVITKIAQMPWI